MPRRRVPAAPKNPTPPDASAERLRQLVSHLPAIIWSTDAELRFTSSLGAGLKSIGLAPDEVVGMPLADFFRTTDRRHPSLVAHRAALAGTPTSYEQAFGGRTFATTIEPLRDATGKIVGTFGCAFDITDRRLAESALRERQTLLDTIVETTPECIKLLDRDGRLLRMNAAGLAMIEADHEDQVRGTDLLAVVAPADRAAFSALNRSVFKGERGHLEFEVIGLKGGRRRLETTAVPLRDPSGAIQALLGVTRDVTDRGQLEEQFRQAQKMEAIGLLAGGIAHDFNNLITAITSNVSFLSEALDPQDPRLQDLQAIRQAADRAATLTQQLLAFSRKQVLRLTVLDLNDTVRRATNLLDRLIGEDVRVITDLAPELWPVKGDDGQLGQVIMNLALNARDAMPEGGTLTIETRNGPGDQVLLTLRDTGVGFDAETRRHLFEPFFTTKALGRGTGLGLATAHGIIKQLGGAITAKGAPGQGSAFQISLPRSTESPAPAEAPRPRSGTFPRSSETVLLVEDEDAVRAVARRTLTAQGYHVVEASGPAAALAQCRQLPGRFDMLVTDVVMPEMSGRELAEQLLDLHPGLPVLYMSGYTDDEMVRRGVGDAGVNFLPKPFTPEELLGKVREVLDTARR